jgi:hypothetical protein
MIRVDGGGFVLSAALIVSACAERMFVPIDPESDLELAVLVEGPNGEILTSSPFVSADEKLEIELPVGPESTIWVVGIGEDQFAESNAVAERSSLDPGGVCGFGPGEADQRRYIRIARGSAYEVAAALDVAHGFDAVTAERKAQGKEICDHLAAMLTRFRNPVRRSPVTGSQSPETGHPLASVALSRAT